MGRSRLFASAGALESLKPLPLPPFGTATAPVPQMTLEVPLRWGKGVEVPRGTQNSAATAAIQAEAYGPCSAVENSSGLSTQGTGTQIGPRPRLTLELGSSAWEMVLEPTYPTLLQ